MAKDKKPEKNEILKDYFMLEKMSKDLLEHQKNIRRIGKRITKAETYNKYGLIENLSSVTVHMGNARKELDRARKELKLI